MDSNDADEGEGQGDAVSDGSNDDSEDEASDAESEVDLRAQEERVLQLLGKKRQRS